MKRNKFYLLFAIGLIAVGFFSACEVTPSGTDPSDSKKVTISPKGKKIEAVILRGESVNETDLAGLASAELRILRNAVFARHGRAYQKDGLGAYFFNCDWYQPNSSFSLDQLTANDRQNVKTILGLENIARQNESQSNANTSNSSVVVTNPNDNTSSGIDMYQYQQQQELLKQQEESRQREQQRQQQEFEDHHQEEEQQSYEQQRQESQRRYEEQQRQQQEAMRRQQETQRQQEYQRQQQMMQQQQQRRY